MNFGERIAEAMTNAPVTVPGQQMGVWEDRVYAQRVPQGWALLGDYDEIAFGQDRTPAQNAVELGVIAPDDDFNLKYADMFRDLVVQSYRRTGKSLRLLQTWDTLAVTKWSVGVWQHLGQRCVTGVRFTNLNIPDARRRREKWEVTPYIVGVDARVPKLGLAAVMLGRFRSEAQVTELKAMGYTPTDVKRKLARHNAAGREPFIPVKLTPWERWRFRQDDSV